MLSNAYLTQTWEHKTAYHFQIIIIKKNCKKIKKIPKISYRLKSPFFIKVKFLTTSKLSSSFANLILRSSSCRNSSVFRCSSSGFSCWIVNASNWKDNKTTASIHVAKSYPLNHQNRTSIQILLHHNHKHNANNLALSPILI